MSSGFETPADAWSDLRSYTAARIALGRSGGSLPTRELLDFALAHARARDAVHTRLESERLAGELRALAFEVLELSSAATTREEYLQRPDLGRKLSIESRVRLEQWRSVKPSPEVAMIVSDGLSARACHDQVPEVLRHLSELIRKEGWTTGPLCLVKQGRVAIQDEIGSLLGARLALIFLGERPGLGSPDSLGAYLIYSPRSGATDADRNCLSNIRPAGLPPLQAATTLHYLMRESLVRKISGVSLKDDRQLTIAAEKSSPEKLNG